MKMTDTKLDILVVCVHEAIRATILRLLHNHNPQWVAAGAANANEAKELAGQKKFDIVLLGNGLKEQEEADLISYFASTNSLTKLIRHYGGGSGLLFGEIYQVLQK